MESNSAVLLLLRPAESFDRDQIDIDKLTHFQLMSSGVKEEQNDALKFGLSPAHLDKINR